MNLILAVAQATALIVGEKYDISINELFLIATFVSLICRFMPDDTFYMNKALEEAKRAYAEGEIPVGAVIVCKDRILARAHNMTEKLIDVTAHAEMQAITAAANGLGGKYLDECTLYVTLEPCPMCAGAIGWAHIGRLVYGASDPKHGYTEFAPQVLHPKTEVVSGVLQEEATDLLKRFFKERRK